jgi:hypothetical protein
MIRGYFLLDILYNLFHQYLLLLYLYYHQNFIKMFFAKLPFGIKIVYDDIFILVHKGKEK